MPAEKYPRKKAEKLCLIGHSYLKYIVRPTKYIVRPTKYIVRPTKKYKVPNTKSFI